MRLLRILCFFIIIYDTIEIPKILRPCPPIKIKFGRVRYRQRGSFVKFTCNTGYSLAGERYSKCLFGKWDNNLPKCVRASCLKIKPPINGLIYPSFGGAVLNFFCKSNYELRGPNVTYCDGIRWDSNLPSCLPTNTTPPLSCNFEHEDLCGWNHDVNHDFDWSRINYKTPSGSIGTGPSFDHTKGEKGENGYYMYIESSSRNINDTARLISPIYDKTQNETCFEFFYHMFGLTTGDLKVYLKKISQDWSILLNPLNALFMKSGNQGDHWYRSLISLGTINEDYQIVIEGVRGSGYVSDIAIDDVKIIENCVFDNEEIISTTTEYTNMELQPYNIESCENRCNNNNFTIEHENFQIMCNCDEKCYEINKCCPDYVDLCVLGTSIDDKSTEEMTESTSTTTVQAIENTTNTKASLILYYTSTPRIPQIITTESNNNNNNNTTILRLVYWSTKSINKKVIIVNKPTKPSIVLMEKPTTIEIYRKILTKLPKYANESKIVYIKPELNNKSNEVIDDNDMMTIPKITNTDEDLLVSQPILTDNNNNNNNKEHLDNYNEETDNDIAVFHGINQKIIIEDNQIIITDKMKYVFIIITTLFILFIIIGGIFVVKRYHLYDCVHLKRINYSSNDDSQSDVRYLTSDEVLDFSLPSSEYDSL